MSSTAWENFINSSVQSKKDYYSDYAPPTGANASQKGLLGSPGAHFVDMSPLAEVPQKPAIIYERTGLLPDHWAQIGNVGDPRGTTLLPDSDQFVQFVSGNTLFGTDELRYDYNTKELIISGSLRVSGKTHVTEVIDRTVEGAISGYSGIFDDLYSNGLHITDTIDTLSGQTLASITALSHQFDGIEGLIDATGQLLESEIDLVSGALDTTGQLLESQVNLVSGELYATGQLLGSEIDLVSGALDATGQLLESEIDLISEALDATGQLLESEIDLVSENLNTTGDFLKKEINFASGEALADSIALADDLQVTGSYLLSLMGGDVSKEINELKNKIIELETNIDLVSGESMSSFVNLSEQIPFFASIAIPRGQNFMEVKYTSIGYTHASNVTPKVSASFRYDPTAVGFYLFGIRDVTHNSFFVDFSDIITENNNFLEIVINKN